MYSRDLKHNTLINVMKKELRAIPMNDQGLISKRDLFKHIQARSNNEMDHEILEQVWEQIEENSNNGKVTLDEFIRVYLEATKILKQKLKQSAEYIKDYQRQKIEAMEQLELLQNTEDMNDHGIMNGSYFNIIVVGATGLKLENPNEQCNAYAALIFDGKTMERTKTIWNKNDPI